MAAYCRVSTDSEEQINSYKNQLAFYTEKINSKTEWKFAGVYADEGITGTSMKHREDFKRMLRACREGRIDLILCKSVSRFGRNSVDVLRTIRALRERGNRGAIREGGRGYPHHEFRADFGFPLGILPIRVRIHQRQRPLGAAESL